MKPCLSGDVLVPVWRVSQGCQWNFHRLKAERQQTQRRTCLTQSDLPWPNADSVDCIHGSVRTIASMLRMACMELKISLEHLFLIWCLRGIQEYSYFFSPLFDAGAGSARTLQSTIGFGSWWDSTRKCRTSPDIVTESQSGWGWKGALKVIWSRPQLRWGHLHQTVLLVAMVGNFKKGNYLVKNVLANKIFFFSLRGITFDKKSVGEKSCKLFCRLVL